jgi:tRNA modification GTPase
MYLEDTIVAPATPPGSGAVAIVRLSGPHAVDILRRMWRPRSAAADALEARRLYLGDIIDPDTGAHLDSALAVIFPRPASLTGEDVVEIQCHGGRYIVGRIVWTAMRLGARMAEPGEFTRRAFLNGRMDLTEAEAVADLIEARGESALAQAMSQLTGALAEKLKALRGELISVRAHLEAEIDFSDEGINLPSRREIAAAIERVAADVAILHQSYQRGRLMREGARAAIVGRPNVGKSSILNLLVGSDRAIVTPIPGTTRDVIEDSIQAGPYPLVLQDTAGMRESSDEVERIGIDRSRRSLADADLVIAVFDASQALTAEDRAVVEQCRGRAGVAILNKQDLPPAVSAADLRQAGVEAAILPLCALKADGIDALRRELVAVIDSMAGASRYEGVAISRARHRESLATALEALEAAKRSADAAMPPEIIAVDVAAAADALGAITGEVHSEDVLDAVFREFCIGK